MKKKPSSKPSKADEMKIDVSAEVIWSTGWTYIRNVVDTAREPFLILDAHLSILAANDAFLRTFDMISKDVSWKPIYELNDGQWNIPTLRRLLEEILPLKTFFKDFEVEHTYPRVGKKVLLMNARQVHVPPTRGEEEYPKMIILAMEDVTRQRLLEEKLEQFSAGLAERLGAETGELMERVEELEKIVRRKSPTKTIEKKKKKKK